MNRLVVIFDRKNPEVELMILVTAIWKINILIYIHIYIYIYIYEVEVVYR